MKKFLLLIFSLILSVCAVMFVACNDPEESGDKTDDIRAVYNTYVAYAEENGETPLSYEEWLLTIKGEKGDKGETGATGQKGDKGDPGKDGKDGVDGAPGQDGTDGKDGKDGENGKDGITPMLRVNEGTNYWEVSYDKGATWTSLNVKATGENGKDGQDGTNGKDGKDGVDGAPGQDGVDGADGIDGIDGITPMLRINEETNYWEISYDKGATWTSLNVKATGENGKDGQDGTNGKDGVDGTDGKDGVDGANGKDGLDGVGIKTITIDDQGRLIVTLTDGSVLDPIEIPKKEEHVHEFGEPICFSVDGVQCDQGIFYQICSDCKEIKWVQGSDCIIGDDFMCIHCNKALGTPGITYELSADGSYAKATGYISSGATHLVIAEEYMGVPVEWISGFSNQSDIKTVFIPNTVKEIGGNAFYNCSGLESVIIPDSVKSIGHQAFFSCDLLTSVVIGNSVTNIGTYAFAYCDLLTKTNYTGTIDDWAMIEFGGSHANPIYYSKNLYINGELVTEVNITKATKISDYAFHDCNSLTSVVMGESVTSIGYCAFYHCNSLTSVVIGNSVTNIGSHAFYGCTSLAYVTIGNSVATIESQSFDFCTSITKTNYTGTIDQWAMIEFGNASSNPTVYSMDLYINDVLVTEVNLTTATKVNEYAFYKCGSIKSVSISNTVKSFGYFAFYDCVSLAKTNYTGTIDDWAMIEFVGSPANPIYYSGHLYINDDLVTEVNITRATKISDYAFAGCNSLTSVVMGDNVTSIGIYAFYYCSALEKIEIPNSVTSIGYYVFNGCSNLKYTVHNGLKYLGNAENPYLFLDGMAEALTDAIIEDGCKIVDYYLFNKTLESVTIPASVMQMKNSFNTCVNLTKVNYLGTIDQWVALDHGESQFCAIFYSKILYINDQLVVKADITTANKVNDYALKNLDSLISLSIGGSVTEIGTEAFGYCDGLEIVTIGDSVTKIGDQAFRQCESLATLIIGKGVKTINSQAFTGCINLTTIKYNGTIEEWNAVTKGSSWRHNVPATVIICTDGQVEL